MMRTKHLIAAVVGCGLLGLVGLAEAGRKKKTADEALQQRGREVQSALFNPDPAPGHFADFATKPPFTECVAFLDRTTASDWLHARSEHGDDVRDPWLDAWPGKDDKSCKKTLKKNGPDAYLAHEECGVLFKICMAQTVMIQAERTLFDGSNQSFGVCDVGRFKMTRPSTFQGPVLSASDEVQMAAYSEEALQRNRIKVEKELEALRTEYLHDLDQADQDTLRARMKELRTNFSRYERYAKPDDFAKLGERLKAFPYIQHGLNHPGLEVYSRFSFGIIENPSTAQTSWPGFVSWQDIQTCHDAHIERLALLKDIEQSLRDALADRVETDRITAAAHKAVEAYNICIDDSALNTEADLELLNNSLTNCADILKLMSGDDTRLFELGAVTLAFPPQATNDNWTGLLEQAKTVSDRVMAGESFESVATELNAEAVRKGHIPAEVAHGSQRGWFFREDQLSEEAMEVLKLSIGELSKPIETPTGVTLIYVYDISNLGTPSLFVEIFAASTSTSFAQAQETAKERAILLEERQEPVKAEAERIAEEIARRAEAQLSAGGLHACGIHTSGAVKCWGHDGWSESSPPSGTFQAVSAGLNHTCGILSSGTIKCWGNNEYRQSSPRRGTFKGVSAGAAHTCGILLGGTVKCWGVNGAGRSNPPSGTFKNVSAGLYHTCGVLKSGAVKCWGDNNDGQMTPPSGTFKNVSAGLYHTCGVLKSGAAKCWGGELYRQSTARRAPSGTFKNVSAGGYHTCGVLTSSAVKCWGDNKYGQSTPPRGTFEVVSAGLEHTCGVLTSGAVKCWGKNDVGQSNPPSGLSSAIH